MKGSADSPSIRPLHSSLAQSSNHVCQDLVMIHPAPIASRFTGSWVHRTGPTECQSVFGRPSLIERVSQVMLASSKSKQRMSKAEARRAFLRHQWLLTRGRRARRAHGLGRRGPRLPLKSPQPLRLPLGASRLNKWGQTCPRAGSDRPPRER